MDVNEDYEAVTHTVERSITFEVGKRFRVSPSQGFDIYPGLVTITYVGPYNDEVGKEANAEGIVEVDPDTKNEVWIGWAYLPGRNSEIDKYYGNDTVYFPAGLLAEHISFE